MYLTIGSVVSMVGTSAGESALFMANVEVKVGTSALKRTIAEHKPPTNGRASGRMRLLRDNWKRSRHRVQGLTPLADCKRTLEAATRRRTARSGGGIRCGSDRRASRIR